MPSVREQSKHGDDLVSHGQGGIYGAQTALSRSKSDGKHQ